MSDLQRLERQYVNLVGARLRDKIDRSLKKRSSSGSAGPPARKSYVLSLSEVMAVAGYACGAQRSLGGPPTEAELVFFLGRIGVART